MIARLFAILLTFSSLSAAVPVRAASFLPGDLVKISTDTAVYYVGQNGKRYVFPTLNTYLTWYADFGSVKTIPSSDLASLPIGGNATYRPGVKMVKIATDPKTYAVAKGGELRWVQTEDIAKALYGNDWNKKIDDVQDVYFVNYKIGDPIASATQYSPASETSQATSINADKNLGVNGPPTVTLGGDKTTAVAGSTVTLTVNAAFQGSGLLKTIIIKNNASVSKYCTSIPCVIQSDPLGAGTSNAFTAEVTDTNGYTGTSNPFTVTVSASNYGY